MLNLVTGGAGFLGSHLVNSLVDDGQRVLVVDDLSTGRIRNLEHGVSSGRATFIFGDVAVPPDKLHALIAPALSRRRIDRIFHFASPASPAAYGARPWDTLAVNAIGTMSLIELALAHGARLLYASTSEVYGDPLVHPQPESYFGNVDPIGPRSCYDEGKRFGEAAVAAAVASRGLDARIVRFFNCYGPGMDTGDGRLVPALLEAAVEGRPFPLHGSGRQTRSMTYVDDAIRLVHLVMNGESDVLQPVNVGNDEERTVEEIAKTLARIAQMPYLALHSPARPNDPQRRKPDLTVARRFGWEPTTSLEDGLRETYLCFKDERLAFA